MRRIAVIFLVAVFVPSLLLGFLALRTAGEQRVILERQLSELYRKDVDLLAGQMGEAILGQQREFADHVRVILSTTKPRHLASDFARVLDVGGDGVAFVVAPDGAIVATQANSAEASRFLRDNEAFLSNRAAAEFFPTQQGALNMKLSANNLQLSSLQSPNAPAATTSNAATITLNTVSPPPKIAANNVDNLARNGLRTVQPQSSNPQSDESKISRITPQISDFQTATSSGTDGVLARYTQNELELILWTRPPEADGYVFGLALPARVVRKFVRNAFAAIGPQSNGACLAVLDENAHPVALSHADFATDWKVPFAASEIGETLPHWEAALYLLNPDEPARYARLMTITIVLLIALALAAILAGGSFVALDARRQLVLAQKKTDFVSNVSHELKTPLTSIRMFAELLEQGRIDEPEKRNRYLHIIILESERLTRLINNVLDFARSGKKNKVYRKSPQDLLPVVERAWEAQSIHLREAGFECEWKAEDAPYPVLADADAIGQVLVNLLSNAEKYSGTRREVSLHARRENGSVRISVLDRGIGVPPGEEGRIFEAFHRSNDSLATGIQGSGLGLTLARSIARDHDGDVEYHKREGGGSEFTLRLPVAGNEEHS